MIEKMQRYGEKCTRENKIKQVVHNDLICYYNFENKYYMLKHNFVILISKLIRCNRTNRDQINW